MSRWQNGNNRSEEVNQTVDEFLEDFEETCSIDWNLAKRTVEERMRYANKLVDFLDGHPLTASKKDLREFIQSWKDDNAIKTVRVIYGKYFDSEIADSFKVPQPIPKPKHVPKKLELREVFDELEYFGMKTAFLILASSGLRRHELMELKPSQIDFEDRIIYPDEDGKQTTKRQWITLYNGEAESELFEEYNLEDKDSDEKIFDFNPDTLTAKFREASERADTRRITPQVLRVWFCNEMNDLGVSDRYIDAFCGRVPKSVLSKHYTDFSPERLKEIYNEANIKVLEGE